MATQTKKAATKKSAPRKAATKTASKRTASTAEAKDGSSKAAQKKDEPVRQTKEEQFEELGVPKEKRGENLHEQNPDLQTSIMRNNLIKQQETQKKALETTVTGNRKAEEGK